MAQLAQEGKKKTALRMSIKNIKDKVTLPAVWRMPLLRRHPIKILAPKIVWCVNSVHEDFIVYTVDFLFFLFLYI